MPEDVRTMPRKDCFECGISTRIDQYCDCCELCWSCCPCEHGDDEVCA